MSAERNIPLRQVAKENLTPQPLLPGIKAGSINGVRVCTIPLPDLSGELVLKGDAALVFTSLFATLPQSGVVPRGAVGRLVGAQMRTTMSTIIEALPLVGAQLTETTDHQYRLGGAPSPMDTSDLDILRVSSVEAAVGVKHDGPLVVVSEEGITSAATRAAADQERATSSADEVGRLAVSGAHYRERSRGVHRGHPRNGYHN